VIRDGLLDTLTTLTPAYQQPAEIQQKIRKDIEKKQAQWKEQHDKHRKNQTLCIGEIVYLRRPPVSTGTSIKLQPKYRGPMIVTAVLAGDTYKIADLHHEGKQLYATTAHISALKRFAMDKGEGSESYQSDQEGQDSDGTEKQAVTTTMAEPVRSDSLVPSAADTKSSQKTSSRKIKKPSYLKDYTN